MDHRNTLVARAPADRALALGRYRLHERLGSGGFGVVWRAHDELLHREVAVKRISLPTDEDRERATREALATARLAHPGIVALYEACSDEQDFYLISELVRGETLAAAIARDALADEELLEVGMVLCDALAHAHARGVVHRDVKPQNVLLPDRAACPVEAPAPVIAKLTDFGGAHLVGEDALTRPGDVLGTLAYMAPEQSEGRDADAQADLYSLALVLYEGLSGVNPVRGATPAATARRIGQRLTPLARERGDLRRPLTHAIDAALSPNPRARGTLAELRDAFEEALDEGPGRTRRHRSRERRVSRESPEGSGPPVESAARAARGASPRLLEHEEEESSRPGQAAPDTAGWLTVERFAWLAGILVVCVWQLGAGRAGAALLVLCAVLPLLVLARRPGPGWLAAGLAPALGVVGLAGAFPALAGQAASWRARALLGALGYWWLRLSEPLLDEPGRRLWLGAPPGTGVPRVGVAWEGSLVTAATRALLPLLSTGLLLGVLLWALAAALLPVLVRGRSAMRDALAATAWAVALAGLTPLLAAGMSSRSALVGAASPRGVVPGAALGAALAIAACAVRERADGRVAERPRERVG